MITIVSECIANECIHGIGTDMVSVSRFATVIQRTPAMVKKLFLPDEIAYCRKRPNTDASFAANFAAKEATLKAFGRGLGDFFWHDMCVHHDEHGKPIMILSGEAAIWAKSCNAEKIDLSLTHDGDYALAFVVVSKKMS